MFEVTEYEFAGPGDFVERYLSQAYMRQVTDIDGVVWCPQWWRHPEALERLTALWLAFEQARLSQEPAALSGWWLGHADPHMQQLMHPRGPFMYCGARRGHTDLLRPLPMTRDGAPPGLFPEPPSLAQKA